MIHSPAQQENLSLGSWLVTKTRKHTFRNAVQTQTKCLSIKLGYCDHKYPLGNKLQRLCEFRRDDNSCHYLCLLYKNATIKSNNLETSASPFSKMCSTFRLFKKKIKNQQVNVKWNQDKKEKSESAMKNIHIILICHKVSS